MSRNTEPHEAIRRSILEAGRSLSAVEILELARRDVPGLDAATVQQVIESLLEEGTLIPVRIPGAADRYDLRDAASKHHHHFICSACGRSFDVPGSSVGFQILTPPGFVVGSHDVVLYGCCDRCPAPAYDF
ncbi:Fur family transcriptional regulator [Planctomyces sp. SH-PL62]|uniref:Fur family transcriptional regulator n=1 Tax=Planctomyces sp. SH-PL62 TaxID=1636152 RepID=UPI00078DE588|nr:transcriptional repressor [Planctomyces sp. SH-PL62]AMV38603.1 Zinc-specific metallo-regulatory protein [Planctomyces sp. SH-PL62]